MREKIPDPSDEKTFHASKLDWHTMDNAPLSRQFRALTRDLLTVRQQKIVPMIKDSFIGAKAELLDTSKVTGGVNVRWRTAKGDELQIIANFAAEDVAMPKVKVGNIVWASTSPSDEVVRPDQIIVRRAYAYGKRL